MQIVGVNGSYRKGRVTDRMVAAVAEGARQQGADVDVLHLRDVEFGYCRNCRRCWDPQTAGPPLGDCPIDDDLVPWLERLSAADGLILASPVNLGALTAVTKKFMERCARLAVMTPLPRFWRTLMGVPACPAPRVKRRDRTTVWITGSGAPAWLGRLAMRAPKCQFRAFAEVWPARVIDFIWVGGSIAPDWELPEACLKRARSAGAKMARSRR